MSEPAPTICAIKYKVIVTNVPVAESILIFDCSNRIDVISAKVNLPRFFNLSEIKNRIIGHPTKKPIE